MDRHILIENFWNVGFDGDKSLTQEELGWSKHIQEDAQSDNPETIFRYIVEIVGLNILFYWMKDRPQFGISRSFTIVNKSLR